MRGTESMATLPSSDTTRDLSPGFIVALTDWIADWGRVTIDSIADLGRFTMFVLETLRWMLFRVPKPETLWPAFYQVGVLSLPVVALTGTFIGMVLAVHSYGQFEAMNLETRLGAVINKSLVSELGPVLAATMLAGRVGSAMAAELGTMRVTEQIDALTSMGANPMYYLVVPRLLACLLLIPVLTIMADFMGVFGGHSFSVYVFNIDMHHYWSNSAEYVMNFDIFSGLAKSLFFGATIALVACYQGFYCGAGAEGVGRAATASFVYSFVIILILDLVLNLQLEALYRTLWPDQARLL